MEKEKRVLRCKSSTDANKLAGSIYSAYVNAPEEALLLRVIGAGSLNQAIKAVIISNKFFIKKGLVVDVHPSFQEVADNSITAIELRIIFRNA